MMSKASNEGSPQTPSSDFPMEAVRHLAEGWHCRCQSNAIHVERNVHWPSCMVGKAQAFLGRKVTFCNPNAEAQRPAVAGTLTPLVRRSDPLPEK